MKSMTGFGRSSSRDKTAGKAAPKTTTKDSAKASVLPNLDVSIRSVNGRYLETRLHLPREYAAVESELKAVVASHFARGTVDVYINRARTESSTVVDVNVELAQKWLDGYRKLGKALKIKGAPSLEMITRIPDVMRVEERSEASDAEKKLLLKLMNAATEACDTERAREGAALGVELESLCAQLESLSEEIMTLRAEANGELEKRLKDRLAKLGFQGLVEDQRMAQEVIMQLDKGDISEELTRLREHVKAYRQLLKSKEPQGKKLDFYAQELLREVNTIGSKSQVSKLTSLVVDAKTIVEKIREQVQNVE